jgi:hypothetical protein
MPSKKQTVPVTERALVQRINRLLANHGQQLQKARGNTARLELGDYYTINVHQNFVVQKDVGLEELGRRLNALRPYESLVTAAQRRKYERTRTRKDFQS